MPDIRGHDAIRVFQTVFHGTDIGIRPDTALQKESRNRAAGALRGGYVRTTRGLAHGVRAFDTITRYVFMGHALPVAMVSSLLLRVFSNGSGAARTHQQVAEISVSFCKCLDTALSNTGPLQVAQ